MIKTLPKELMYEPFTYKQALTLGLTQYSLRCLLEQEVISRVGRGVYLSYEVDLSEEIQFAIASLVVGEQSAICLLSALSYYVLTDIIPKKVWVIVSSNKRTTNKDLKIFRTTSPKWHLGVDKKNGFYITSIERTLVECLVNKKYFPASAISKSIKLAIEEKMTTGDKILKMSACLKLNHKVVPYLEVLL